MHSIACWAFTALTESNTGQFLNLYAIQKYFHSPNLLVLPKTVTALCTILRILVEMTHF